MEEQKIKESTAILAKQKGMFFIDEYEQPFWKEAKKIAFFSLKGKPKGYVSFNMEDQAYSEIKTIREDYFDTDRLLLIVSQAKVLKWLRDNHEIHIEISLIDNTKNFYWEYCIVTSKDRDYNDMDCVDCAKRHYNRKEFTSYEEAMEAGIIKALHSLKDKENAKSTS